MPLVEFAYNNNFETSSWVAPYEALYGRKCRSPICWDDVGERKLMGSDLVQVTIEKFTNTRNIENSTKSKKPMITIGGTIIGISIG